MEQKSTLTVKELIDFLNVGRKKAYELVNSKGFPAFRIGRKVLISRDGLERWIKEQQDRKDEN